MKNKVFKFFKKNINIVSKSGVKLSYDKSLSARIILSNRIMLICIGLTFPFTVGFYVLNQPLLAIGIIILCFGYSSCMILHKKKTT